MAFCPSCGKELTAEESTAKFCAYCGNPLDAEAGVSAEAPVYTETPAYDYTQNYAANAATPVQASSPVDGIVEKAKTIPVIGDLLGKINKNLYPVVIAVPVVVLVLIIVLVIGLFSSGSYMSPLNDFLNQANRKTADAQKLTSTLMADFRYNLMKKVVSVAKENDDMADSLEDANDRLEDSFDELDDEFKKWNIKFETKSKEKLDKDEVEELQESLEDYYDDYIESTIDYYEDILDDEDAIEEYADDMDVDEEVCEKLLKAYIKYYESFEDVKVSEVYEVKGKFIVTADRDEYKTETVKLRFAKLNNNWVYAGCDGSLSLEDDDEGYFNFIMDYLENDYTRQ